MLVFMNVVDDCVSVLCSSRVILVDSCLSGECSLAISKLALVWKYDRHFL